MTESWSLDNAITVAPAGDAKPVISRQRALCTLLAANDIRSADLLEDGSGLTLILARVTVSDSLIAEPDQYPPDSTDLNPPALTAFHSRLAWVAVVDPPILVACPSQPPVSSSDSPGNVDASPNVPSSRLVTYQLAVLDATTGTDGLVYAARTNDPCYSGVLDGPYVRPLMVSVSVPWRLISRDPGGLFDTIALAVTTCDDFTDGFYATAGGVVEVGVTRPIATCGRSRESDQTLQGPEFGGRLATNLTHAATGFADTLSATDPMTSATADTELCAGAFSVGAGAEPVAASYPVTVDDLRRISGGPAPGIHPFTSPLEGFAGGAQAAWCEVKTSNGYLISAVDPNGAPLVGVQDTVRTFQPLPAGIPALP